MINRNEIREKINTSIRQRTPANPIDNEDHASIQDQILLGAGMSITDAPGNNVIDISNYMEYQGRVLSVGVGTFSIQPNVPDGFAALLIITTDGVQLLGQTVSGIAKGSIVLATKNGGEPMYTKLSTTEVKEEDPFDQVPTGFYANDITASGATLQWDETYANEDGYQLALDDGTVELLAPNSDSFTFPALNQSTEYEASLRAYKGAKYTPAATTVFVTRTLNPEGRTVYVSTSGNSLGDGTQGSPFATLENALASNIKPGDKIAFKRGDTFGFDLSMTGVRGASDAPITLGAYGNGDKPDFRVGDRQWGELLFCNYVTFEDLEYNADPQKVGLRVVGDCRYITFRRLDVIGHSSYTCESGISYANPDNQGNQPSYIVVQECNVSRYGEAIRGNAGLKDKSAGIVRGGLIENNHIFDCNNDSRGDAFRAFGGDFQGMIVRGNLIEGWGDDAIDLFNAHNVIVEHNTLRNPKPGGGGSKNGIKAGGVTNSSSSGVTSRNNIIRYNHVYNLADNGAAMDSNGGQEIDFYGNLVHDCPRGLMVSSISKNCAAWNNTIYVDGDAFFCNTENDTVRLENNILSGGSAIAVKRGSTQVLGKNNWIVSGGKSGNYTSQGDRNGNPGLNSNYEPNENSPVVDAGVPVVGYTKDRKKNPIVGGVDIGCHQYPDN